MYHLKRFGARVGTHSNMSLHSLNKGCNWFLYYKNVFCCLIKHSTVIVWRWRNTKIHSMVDENWIKRLEIFVIIPLLCPAVFNASSFPLNWNSPCRGEGASHQEVSTQVHQREELNWASQLKSSGQKIFSTMSSTDSELDWIRQRLERPSLIKAPLLV